MHLNQRYDTEHCLNIPYARQIIFGCSGKNIEHGPKHLKISTFWQKSEKIQKTLGTRTDQGIRFLRFSNSYDHFLLNDPS